MLTCLLSSRLISRSARRDKASRDPDHGAAHEQMTFEWAYLGLPGSLLFYLAYVLLKRSWLMGKLCPISGLINLSEKPG